jgi:hypothetical protein
LAQPRVMAEFDTMTSIERTLEALRYSLTLLEYRTGANGWIRAWAISTLRIFIFALFPLSALLIIVHLLLPIAAGLEGVFQHFELATKSLFWGTVNLVCTMILIAAAISFLAIFIRSRA